MKISQSICTPSPQCGWFNPASSLVDRENRRECFSSGAGPTGWLPQTLELV
jgi:hypothetical protein